MENLRSHEGYPKVEWGRRSPWYLHVDHTEQPGCSVYAILPSKNHGQWSTPRRDWSAPVFGHNTGAGWAAYFLVPPPWKEVPT